MPDSPKKIAGRLKTVADAWKSLAPDARFGGMTLDEFKAAVKPSWDGRDAVARLKIDLLAAQDERDDADKESLNRLQLVVNGVKGTQGFGSNCGLYEAMGYVRKSEIKSGRKPKAKKSETDESKS